ncbi:hypothetical protein [Neomesorhizobium albiziae]|uniref:hypothetical protein n=1 Tax=Neomesorhizobium albiziae TaxID=335020 RepID=UPI00122CA091|nr:hypothetical protein [Mesorhizobium albiziae]
MSILNEIVPSAERQPYNPGDLDTAPLARAMRNLWETALSSGDDRSDICLKLKKGSDDNTYQMGITVVKGLNGEIGVGLSNVALSASGKFTSTTGNTVTVKFEPHDFAALQRKREACRKGDPKCGSQYHMAPPQLDCAPADTRCQNVYQRQYLQQ